MLLGNYSIHNANPGRQIGGYQDPFANIKAGTMQGFYSGDHEVVGQTDKSAFNNGYIPPYSWMLSPKAGGLSSVNNMNGTGTLTITSLSQGKALSSTMAGVGTVSTANLSLVSSLAATIAGSGTLSASMVGVVNMACTLAGTGNMTAAMGALAFCAASLSGSGTVTSNLKGKSWMESTIYVNEGAATVDQIVDGVVDGIGSVTATIPNLLNTESGDIIIPLD
jgi:hypothetical protein